MGTILCSKSPSGTSLNSEATLTSLFITMPAVRNAYTVHPAAEGGERLVYAFPYALLVVRRVGVKLGVPHRFVLENGFAVYAGCNLAVGAARVEAYTVALRLRLGADGMPDIGGKVLGVFDIYKLQRPLENLAHKVVIESPLAGFGIGALQLFVNVSVAENIKAGSRRTPTA